MDAIYKRENRQLKVLDAYQGFVGKDNYLRQLAKFIPFGAPSPERRKGRRIFYAAVFRWYRHAARIGRPV